MHFITVLLAFLFLFQPVQGRMSVEDCLLLYGDSHVVYDYYARILSITGESVQVMGQDYQTVLATARPVAGTRLVTDTGYRRVQWYLYEDQMYIAVFRHLNAPGAYVENEHGPDDFHLSCLIGNLDLTEQQA